MPRKAKTSVAELVKDTPELDVSTVNGATVVEEFEQATFDAPQAAPVKRARKPRQYSPELAARIAELEKLQAEIKAAKQAEAPTKTVRSLEDEVAKQNGAWQQFIVASLANRVRRREKLGQDRQTATREVLETFEGWLLEELQRPTPTPRMRKSRSDEEIPADF